MRLIINVEERIVPDELTLAALVRHLSLTPERLAIERNLHVVRRADWPTTPLEENDRIEIIHFVGGGGNEKQGKGAIGEMGKRETVEKIFFTLSPLFLFPFYPFLSFLA